MNMMRSYRRSFVLPASACAALLWLTPGTLGADPLRSPWNLKVETTGHRFFADVGESGGDFTASAMLSVLVTRDGVPVTNLGASIPLNENGVTLPPAWKLTSSFTAPPGPLGIGCILSPTDFTNRGDGIYTIRVAPYLNDPVCRWGLGDYHYVISIRAPFARGSSLGVLTIPDTPSVP